MITKQQKIGTGFGSHNTADDVLAGIDVTGTTALVTGGYSGLDIRGFVRPFPVRHPVG